VDLNADRREGTGGSCAGATGAKDSEKPDGKYIIEETVLGRVWIPREGLIITPPAAIRYEKHPWMEKFEFDGIKAAPAKRKGIGTKGAKAFVKSLSTIYSGAYDDYREYGGDEAFDAEGYFRHAARHFADMAEDELTVRMFDRFSGFAENMWREGSAEMLAAAMETVLPVLAERPHVWSRFLDNITDEFRQYIEDEVYGREDNGI
jgi:hypothetical protein